ncbi:cell surface hyaluronidase-like [Haliotis rufescens]|uniref:cell surface hyaluronidase-like n=1 Tax=Haliotis rufescens TaxID=6454 RepID=UPI00201ED23A|nr:cell surface hyaluronidase-like [Haliotis rufescens]
MRVLLQLAIVCLSVGVGESACPHLEAGLENWGDTTSWTSGVLPVEDDQVVIPSGKKLLLNVSPPCLSSITIEAGAALVWGDVDNLNVCVSYILIRGRLQIGSEDCRFTRKTHIRLIGESNSTLVVQGFGRKFIGVDAGGTIEVHGEEKPSWTKLIKTAYSPTDGCENLFNFQESQFNKENGKGLYVTVFNMDGSLWDFALFRTGDGVDGEDVKFKDFVTDIPNDKILAVAIQGELGTGDMSAVYETLESAGGLTSSAIRAVTGRQAYAFITKTGDAGTTREIHVSIPNTGGYRETGYLSLDDNGYQFLVNSKVYIDPKMTKGINFMSVPQEARFPCITVNADVSKWRPGDKVVIASTDFDWRQAEEMTIKSCPSCEVNQICFTEPLQYMHYGEVTLGVDERAEVGLLSRNILIEGVIPEDGCSVNEPEDQYLCDLFGFDTFGGQIKILRDFEAAHIQGVELFHMGQQRFSGSYPLHFHMCDDADGQGFQHNSLHHCLARCVTVHGTDGAEVSDNVCYLHHGHGFFLEDSAEQRNVFDSNLCIGTMHGTHIMSDMKKEWCNATMRPYCDALSSYWITHPNNTFINNVAAGSDNTGFWILASRHPLGPSRQRQQQRGLVPEFHAMQTKVKEFRNNTAHSNMNAGFNMDDEVSIGEVFDGDYVPENGIVSARVSHSPRNPPGDPDAALDKSYLYSFTGYKNRELNVWTKGGITIMDSFTLADSPVGLTMSWGESDTYTQISNSLFIGETDNKGLPVAPFGRSVATSSVEPLQGVTFYQGPGYVSNSFFDKYVTKISGSTIRYAGAVSVRRSSHYPVRASSSVKGVKFGFCDVSEGNWALNGDPSYPLFDNIDGNRQNNFLDVDGSVSGTPGTQFVPNTRFLTTNQCDYRQDSNFAVCPHDYARVLFTGDGALDTLRQNFPMFLRRDDRPDDPFSVEGVWGNNYLVIKKKSYTVYFNGASPFTVQVKGHNLGRGDYVRLGLCYPKDVTSFTFQSYYPLINTANPAVQVDSISDLDSDTTGRAYFWDQARGLLFVKVYSDAERIDGEHCPGRRCQAIKITRNGGSNSSVDCYASAYDGTYNRTEDAAVNIPTAKTCVKTSSDGYGAEVEPDFFEVAESNTPTCVTGGVQPELKGCYGERYEPRDLPYAYVSLPTSLTVDVCVTRCHTRGYAFAGVSNGRECACGDAYGGYGASSDCNKPCVGDNDVNCGGYKAVAVYTTGIAEPASFDACGPDGSGASIDGKCFYLTSGSYSFVEAQQACVDLGGNLATIDSEDVQVQVARYMRPKRTDAWFGLNDIVDEGVFEFADGSPRGSYSNFLSGQGTSQFQDGVALMADRLYLWFDQNVDSSFQALCQLPLTTTPDVEGCGHHGYGQQVITTGGGCYLVHNTPGTYDQAMFACYTRRGSVATASDTQMLADIVEHLDVFGQEINYWVAKEGRVYYELQHATSYSKQSADKLNLNGVVCKIETLTDSTPCSSDWYYRDDNCYLTVRRWATFSAASAFCNQGDSRLLTVQDDGENTFVGGYTSTQLWLDFVYSAASGNFELGNGSTSTYTNWDVNQGGSNVVNGECARTKPNNQKWKNVPCTEKSWTMCKAPAGP